ncbi:predicted protein [Chaetoceros tenuissimus]|uniref:PDZ domain-containing protein n=1 Tax=Chaetoceros tenuissimus TaxID=426638 RepID=A0AAD3CME5_9STRA|nr:predicted protein [Chaetoceros tenuissimus]
MDSSHSNEETEGCHDSPFLSSDSAQMLPCNNNAARVTPETIAQEFNYPEQDYEHFSIVPTDIPHQNSDGVRFSLVRRPILRQDAERDETSDKTFDATATYVGADYVQLSSEQRGLVQCAKRKQSNQQSNAKRREKRAKQREQEEEMMKNMDPSELEEYFQAKEAKRVENNAKRRENYAKQRVEYNAKQRENYAHQREEEEEKMKNMDPSELEEYLQAKEAKRVENNAKRREKRAKQREQEEEMMNSMDPSELEEYLQAKEAERNEKRAKQREQEEEMMNSMDPSELEEYLQAKEAKRVENNAKRRENYAKQRVEHNAKQRENYAHQREEEEEKMKNMDPSELEEYLQAKEAKRVENREKRAKQREEEEEMMNSMEPSELEEYLQAKEAKRVEYNAKQRENYAKQREEEEEKMKNMDPSELEEYLQAKEAKRVENNAYLREWRVHQREEEEEMMNSMDPSELEEYLQAKEAKRVENNAKRRENYAKQRVEYNAKRRENYAKQREEEEEMMNSMDPSELEEYLQAKEAYLRECRAKRKAKKKEENAVDENEGIEREPTKNADEIKKSVNKIFTRWNAFLNDLYRSNFALYASFTAENPNLFSTSRALFSSESHNFLTNPTFYISNQGFLCCKGAGPSLLFSSPRKDFGARCRRKDSNGVLVSTELDYRILSTRYLEEQLDAKFIILHQCKSRTNARNIENEIQGRLDRRKFGTENLWRAIDRGNYEKRKGDDTATFTVGLTVLNAVKIRDLIKNGVIVVNKGKWSHSKYQYFHELDNGERQYYKRSNKADDRRFDKIDFGLFTVQTSQEVLRIRVIQTKYCYLEIDEVHDDSPLNGLVRKGDQIRAINGRDMSNSSGRTFVEALQSLRTEKKTITIWRG